MNAKSERIEQLIQIINRNLLLIFNGQAEGVTPLDHPTGSSILEKPRSSQGARQGTPYHVDISVFDGDKFGYEMVSYIRSYVKTNKNSLPSIWERNFVKGLETLITECAVIKDSIERECFVGRVYVWFTEKLVEKRDLPQEEIEEEEIKVLKTAILAMGGFHSAKALDSLTKHKQDESKEQPENIESSDGDNLHHLEQGDGQVKLPPIHGNSSGSEQPTAGNTVSERVRNPAYDEETDQKIQDLWLARRQQEAFEWKTRQNLNLIMDRRELQRSRLESEALRREETSSYIAGPQKIEDIVASSSLYDDNSRYAPKMRRPLSGKQHFAGIIRDIEDNEDIQTMKSGVDASSLTLDSSSIRSIEAFKEQPIEDDALKDETVESKTKKNPKSSKKPEKKQYVPMRFRTKAPDSMRSIVKKQSTNLELNSGKVTPKAEADSSTVPPAAEAFNTDALIKTTRPSFKQRSGSSTSRILQNFGSKDSELQVYYEYSVSRKCPLTLKHQEWLQVRSEERIARDEAYNKKLVDAVQSEAEKKKKPEKSRNGKPNRKSSKKSVDEESVASTDTVPKYSSAKDFMEKHFPSFDVAEEDEAHGVLRLIIPFISFILANFPYDMKARTVGRV